MKAYCVNNRAQANGDHEVHTDDCRYLPNSRTTLGVHASCHSAVAAAKRIYKTANGCRTCSPVCHTS